MKTPNRLSTNIVQAVIGLTLSCLGVLLSASPCLAQNPASTAKPGIGINTVVNCASAKNNYIPVFTAAAPPNITICNSAMFQAGSNIGVGTTTPVASLDVNGSINAAQTYQIGAQTVLSVGSQADANVFLGEAAGSSNIAGQGKGNTFSGGAAGYSNSSGYYNTFSGNGSGYANTTGKVNTFYGFAAGLSNTTADANTFVGSYAGFSNTTGIYNTFTGGNAGYSNTAGNNNTFSGLDAGFFNTTGGANTFVGYYSGNENSTKSFNTFYGAYTGYHNAGTTNLFVGYSAGYNNTTGSNDIYVGNQGPGAGTESNTIRIGDPSAQSAAYMAGIYGTTSSDGVPVYINFNGQLGTSPSSLRFKEQVHDMGDSSSKLFQLRPVTFFYKPQYDDGSHQLQYGLIAEEVAKVYPDMVAYDKDGQPYTVKYQLLAPMLLNELQKQHSMVAAQQDVIKTQQEQIQSLRGQNEEFQQRLSRLESLMGNK